MFTSTISLKKAALGAALVGATLTGGAVGAALITPASAQTPSTSTTAASGSSSTAASTPAPTGTPGDGQAGTPRDPHLGGHQANGITETLLTGDNLAKATAAANAAVPGGTIQRAENDAEGAAYEVHMLDKSGNQVTVKLDSSFNVTKTEQGM